MQMAAHAHVAGAPASGIFDGMARPPKLSPFDAIIQRLATAIAEEHLKLPKKDQKAALEKWAAAHA
jgi:hypothetical protein